MGKRDTKKVNNDIKTDQTASNQRYEGHTGAVNTAGNAADTRANEGRGDLDSGLKGLSSYTPSTTISSINPIEKANFSTIGKRDPVKFNTISNAGNIDLSRARNMADTGGLDEGSMNRMRGMGGFEKFAEHGASNAGSANRMRGNGVFDEFAATGGYTDADKANILNRATSPISAFATGTRDELARRRSVQGGYAPGFDASSRALNRDTARQIADTSLSASLGIADAVRQGRFAGAGAAADSEGRVVGNQLAGIGGVSSSEQGAQGLRTGNMLQGAGMLGGFEDSNYNRANSVNMFNSQGMFGADSLNANRQDAADFANNSTSNNFSQFNAARGDTLNGLNLQRDALGLQRDGQQLGARLAGIQGQADLYANDRGFQGNMLGLGANVLGSRDSANLGYYQPRTQLATQPGWGSHLAKGLGIAGGIGANLFMPGISGMPGATGAGGWSTQVPR